MAGDEHHGRRIPGDGVELALWEGGNARGPTVLLVHGYPDTHAVWTGVARALAADHHVVAHDVRGAGASEAPTSREGYDLEHLVADLAAVADATSPHDPVHLVGHDWGSIQCWEAVCTERMAGRVASFTSISGPCLDHVAEWYRRRLAARRPGDLRALLAQASRSWYVAAFQLPALAPLAWQTAAPAGVRRQLRRLEGIDVPWHPAPTMGRDGANGVELYRQNVPDRMRDPRVRRTDVPVQLIVPLDDRFVTPALLDGVEDNCTTFTRRDTPGGHWLPVAEPDVVAGWIAEHVARNAGSER